MRGLRQKLVQITDDPEFKEFLRRYELCSDNNNKCINCPEKKKCVAEYDIACGGHYGKTKPPRYGENENVRPS